MEYDLLNGVMNILTSNLAWISWFLAALAFFVVEAATVNLTTIWFGIGALMAMLVALFGGGILLQVLVFLIVSGVTLVIFLKIFKPRFTRSDKGPVRTNADRIIDQLGLVVKEINPDLGTGQIRVMDQDWTAASQDRETIPVGTRVKVVGLEGVKAIVEKEI